MNIRQSTLSRRLHEIERRLGMVSFERTNCGTHPTTVGMEFIANVKRILDDVNTKLQQIRSRSRDELGSGVKFEKGDVPFVLIRVCV